MPPAPSRLATALTRGLVRTDLLVAGAVLVLQVAVTTAVSFHENNPHPRALDPLGFVLLGFSPVLLVWRRLHPSAVLVAVYLSTLAYTLLDYPRGPVYLALVVAFVHAVVDGRRWVAYAVMLTGYLTLTLLAGEVTNHHRPSAVFQVAVGAWLLVLLVGSELIRIRKAYRDQARRAREEAELMRQEEERRRATESRLQLARDLHDVMAHSISLINVQAGVALELMDRRPEQARQALTAIKAASKDALVEVQSVLNTLRHAGEAAPLSPTALPAPRLSAPQVLVDRARLAGVPVELRVDGEARALPVELDRAGARIVQEALTNVARHAAGARTRLTITYAADLVIEVIDEGAPQLAPPSPGGQGIAGMRERAVAFGGTLEAGPCSEGGFAVRAVLPLPVRAQTSGAQA